MNQLHRTEIRITSILALLKPATHERSGATTISRMPVSIACCWMARIGATGVREGFHAIPFTIRVVGTMICYIRLHNAVPVVAVLSGHILSTHRHFGGL